jgi:hypothetical protein
MDARFAGRRRYFAMAASSRTRRHSGMLCASALECSRLLMDGTQRTLAPESILGRVWLVIHNCLGSLCHALRPRMKSRSAKSHVTPVIFGKT